jgi:hypothetical protein
MRKGISSIVIAFSQCYWARRMRSTQRSRYRRSAISFVAAFGSLAYLIWATSVGVQLISRYHYGALFCCLQ